MNFNIPNIKLPTIKLPTYPWPQLPNLPPFLTPPGLHDPFSGGPTGPNTPATPTDGPFDLSKPGGQISYNAKLIADLEKLATEADTGAAGVDPEGNYGPAVRIANDPVYLNLLSRAKSALNIDDINALQQYVQSKVGQQQSLSRRVGAEGGITSAFDESSAATMKSLQPGLEQQLADLGILHGGALTANTQNLANQMSAQRARELTAYRTGASNDMASLDIDQLDALSSLRNQQRAQQLAMKLGEVPNPNKFQTGLGGATSGAKIGYLLGGPAGAGLGGAAGFLGGSIWG